MSRQRFDCAAAREAVHVSLDAELMDAGLRQPLETHLAECAACREFASEMRMIQGGLRGLPELKLPDEVLERVWDRTTRASRKRPWSLVPLATMAFGIRSFLPRQELAPARHPP